MGLLPMISGKQAIKCFLKLGYVVTRQRGSHIRLIHSNAERKPLTIPDAKEVRVGLLRRLIRDAGISVQEFMDLM